MPSAQREMPREWHRGRESRHQHGAVRAAAAPRRIHGVEARAESYVERTAPHQRTHTVFAIAGQLRQRGNRGEAVRSIPDRIVLPRRLDRIEEATRSPVVVVPQLESHDGLMPNRAALDIGPCFEPRVHIQRAAVDGELREILTATVHTGGERIAQGAGDGEDVARDEFLIAADLFRIAGAGREFGLPRAQCRIPVHDAQIGAPAAIASFGPTLVATIVRILLRLVDDTIATHAHGGAHPRAWPSTPRELGARPRETVLRRAWIILTLHQISVEAQASRTTAPPGHRARLEREWIGAHAQLGPLRAGA